MRMAPQGFRPLAMAGISAVAGARPHHQYSLLRKRYGSIVTSTTWRKREDDSGQLETRSELLPVATHGDESALRDGGLCRGIRSHSPDARRPGRRRCRSGIEDLFQDPQHGHDAQSRRRAASFWLECVLILSLSERAS